MPGTPKVYIRRAGPEDIPEIDSLHKSSIRGHCSSSYSEEQINDWISALKPRGYLHAMESFDFMVAVQDGVVGLCIFNAGRAELTALYVSPPCAGKGVGRALVQEVEGMAREAGIRELHLKSTLNAVGFYERMGFTRIERAVYVLPSGTELPCVVMAKRLSRRSPARR